LSEPCRQGVLAFGDSITNGGGELQWGVALQSWALWTARGVGVPYTGFARDGAMLEDVLRRQLPAWRATAARPDASYDLGCLYIGVNDVRGPRWDRDAFAAGYREALAAIGERCERVLAVTLPLDLGRPRATARARDANDVIRDEAGLVLDLEDFGARNLVMTDHVHPTAFGQIAIAERALDVLAAAGVHVRVRPSTLVEYETTRLRRLRGDVTYVYRAAKVSARAALARRAGRAGAGSSDRRRTAAARTRGCP
jgi:lysophospholipase L1-like esterase